MLQQTQAKIIGTPEFTNRLAYLTAAIETCVRSYSAPQPGNEVKRMETREGFGMLLFLPPSPKGTDVQMYDNIVCHRYYRGKLAQAQELEQKARERIEKLERGEGIVSRRLEDVREDLSKAKQRFYARDAQDDDAKREIKRLEGRQRALKRAHSVFRGRIKETQALVKTEAKRAGACLKKIKELDDRRLKNKGSETYALFADRVRVANGRRAMGVPAQGLADDPALHDDVIGLRVPVKTPTCTDVSRLRTDTSNAAILGEFVSGNQVKSPKWAAEDFPVCHTSLVRDNDDDFKQVVADAARCRVGELIAVPELLLGSYDERDRDELLARLTDGKEPLELAGSDETGLQYETNILYELVANDAFPVAMEELIRPAVLEALSRFGEEEAGREFARKLKVLAYNEQLARTAYADALDGAGGDRQARYVDLLVARGNMLTLALDAALLGSEGVSLCDADMRGVQGVPTLQPRNRRKGKSAESVCYLVEQIPNAEGGFSFGRAVRLDETQVVQVGRAPYLEEGQQVIVPAGALDVPGYVDFAAAVSRAHATLEYDGEYWLLSDAGSLAGVAVLGPRERRSLPCGTRQRVVGMLLEDDERTVLCNGDVIALAPLTEGDCVTGVDALYGFSYRFEVMGGSEG